VRIRAIAVKILYSVFKNQNNYEILLEDYSRKLKYDQKDRDFLYSLVKGVIQYKKYLDHIIEIAAKRSIKKMEPTALDLLRIGVYQAEILKTPKHAYVFETVEAAKELGKKRLAPFVNGVLRNLPDENHIRANLQKMEYAGALAVKYSHPFWLVERWLINFGREAVEGILDFNNKYQTIYFRHNPVKINWSEFREKLNDSDFVIRIFIEKPIVFFSVENPGRLLKSSFFKEGYCSVQDISQAFSVLLLAPQSGEKILDVCAAPGGKTTFIAQLQNNKGRLLSSDISKKKIALIKNETSRLGLNFINYRVADAASAEFEMADKILIDAPCSGTGVIARRADLRWNRQPSDIEDLQKLQMDILHNMAKYVGGGGVIIYSTCSMEYEENWGVIDKFISQHSEFVVESPEKYIDKQYCNDNGSVEIFPHQHGVCGSFSVRLLKKII